MPRKKKFQPKTTGSKQEIRRRIIEAFQDSPNQLLNYKRISKKLNIKKEAIKKLVHVIMEELGESGELVQVDRGNFRLNFEQTIVEGRIDMTNRGAAYLVCEGMDEDIFIPPKSINRALHGDVVKAGLVVRKRGRRHEAEVLEVVKRAKTDFVGTIELHENFGFVIADDKKMLSDIFIPGSELGKVINGEKVVARITEWPENSNKPTGSIIDVLGMAGENETEMHAILAEFGLPYKFSEQVLEEAEKISGDISKEEIKKRRDMRETKTFTIDPDDAKDFDDAISFRRIDDGLVEIGVHIADVSHYLEEGSVLDREAFDRATSVYLVDRVVPMLPERLSNDLCSLNPHTDKLCFSAVFQIDPQAKVRQRWFGRTVIHSDKRFTYAQAQEVLDSGKGDLADELKQVNDLAKKLRKSRFKNGSIGFDSLEVKFELDENGKPLGVKIKHHSTANELIEEFMLLANREVAEFIGKPKSNEPTRTFVYRIHDSPDEEKLANFKEFIKKFGYGFSAKSNRDISESFNRLFDKIEGKSEEYVIEQLAIRTMAKAVYSTKNIGHYGLHFSHYSHFTSPIRRYPDVMVHRLLQHYLDNGKSADQSLYESHCKHCSSMEKMATDAERSSIKYKQVQFMQDKVGEVFEGIISGMNDYGIFVELTENKCEGMIRLRSMSDDYYYFDNKDFCVIGTRKKRIFEIGQKAYVKISKADLLKKQLDFELVQAT
ncbi:MAG: ribonuclease R [Vicingaceae bacterium]